MHCRDIPHQTPIFSEWRGSSCTAFGFSLAQISHTTNILLFKFRCNIFIGVRIIKEMPGSVPSGTPCIMFSMITNIYSKRTKGPTLMELFTATGKLNFFLTTRDVFKFLPHTRQHVDMCVARTWISYQCVPCHLWYCQKKKLFQFSCGCEQFHWGRSFGFLIVNVSNHGEHYEMPCIMMAFIYNLIMNLQFRKQEFLE